MANHDDKNEKHEESSPLLGNQLGEEDAKKAPAPAPLPVNLGGHGWTADGLPLGHGSVVGEPLGRTRWGSSLFACFGDLEVCLLGSLAPCVLYGNNAERLASTPGSFARHCWTYAGLCLLGSFVFRCNFLAPWFSSPSRTAIRQKFNLEGSCEAFHRSCGCCGSFLEDEAQREQCETACDFATHFCCHRCSLCQESRELDRRLLHPGFTGQPILVMMPPVEQSMGHRA